MPRPSSVGALVGVRDDDITKKRREYNLLYKKRANDIFKPAAAFSFAQLDGNITSNHHERAHSFANYTSSIYRACCSQRGRDAENVATNRASCNQRGPRPATRPAGAMDTTGRTFGAAATKHFESASTSE